MPAKFNVTPALTPSDSLADLDAAIRSLETSTNPSLRRPCNCDGTRHPLLTAAPNCLSCGKIICVREGLGPCTFCKTPLLSTQEVQAMIRVLRDERGRERMQLNNASQRRAEVASKPRPFSSSQSSSNSAIGSNADSLARAEEHRNRLLGYQATSAKRTHIIDEAADFETPSAGQSLWATPQERALQLKRQQKVLREQQWNAKPEYEKRRTVLSIDLAGGKVTKRMTAIEPPKQSEYDHVDDDDDDAGLPNFTSSEAHQDTDGSGTAGSFAQNPLLGSLLRPVYKDKAGVDREPSPPRQKPWRRVQDDLDDNEEVILDGGVYGPSTG